MHNRNRRVIPKVSAGGLRRGQARHSTGRQGHRHVPISGGVGVGKCSTGLYLYEPKSDGFGSPPRCRRCRANDDSITQAVPRLYRDNPAEVGGTARSWRPETHVATHVPRTRAQRSAVDTHAQACPVHLFSFLFFFFSRRIRLSALLAHERMYTLDVVTREQSDKESPTARSGERRESSRMQLPQRSGIHLPDAGR